MISHVFFYTQKLEECIRNDDKEGAEILMNEWELRGLTEGL